MTAYVFNTLQIVLRIINKEDITIYPRKAVYYDQSQTQPQQPLVTKDSINFL
jgi:hypothetical protein